VSSHSERTQQLQININEHYITYIVGCNTMVPLVVSTFGKLGPAAEGYLQNIASVACSIGVVDRGVWLRISR
jgi:hypothetical protein